MEYWFRGKKLNGNKNWEYGGVDDKCSSIVSYHQFIPIDPSTLGLKMGTSDICGCSVYHGDILKLVDSPELCLITVLWSNYGWTFELHKDSVVSQFPDHFTVGQCKVVGNTWDGYNLD